MGGRVFFLNNLLASNFVSRFHVLGSFVSCMVFCLVLAYGKTSPQNSPTGTSSGDDIILKMFEDIYIYIYIEREIDIYFL